MTTPELIVLLAGATLIVNGRTTQALVAYVVLAATASFVLLPPSLASPTTLALFSVSTILKVVLAPVGLRWFLRANPAADDMSPSAPAPARIALAIVVAAAAASIAHDPILVGIPLVGTAAFTVLCGIGMLVLHRNLLAHMIGLLVLGSGIELAGAMLAPGLPASFELGASFDVLVATFIGLALVRAIAAHNPLLDVESLRRLRG
jgi:hydrogenase-4 component E